jgi:hypothetical protein
MKVGITVQMLVVLALCVTATAAEVPQMINYQGRLANSSGEPLDTTVAMTFSIYEAGEGGTAIWSETHSIVEVIDGLFSVILGSAGSPLPDSIFDGEQRYLGITVGTDAELSPRTRLVSAGYAHRVASIDGARAGSLSGVFEIGPGSGKEGRLGDAALVVRGDNADSVVISPVDDITIYSTNDNGDETTLMTSGAKGAAVLVTATDVAKGALRTIEINPGDSIALRAHEVGGDDAVLIRADGAGGVIYVTATDAAKAVTRKVEIAPRDSIVLSATEGNGDQVILITADPRGGAILVSATDVAKSDPRSIAGSIVINKDGIFIVDVTTSDTTVAITPDGNIQSDGQLATGEDNVASGDSSSVSGGHDNTASGTAAAVGGGGYNTALGAYSTVAGGFHNQAEGDYSAITGGNADTANGDFAYIGGGALNRADSLYAVVSGGLSNIAGDSLAVVAGGRSNAATGLKSTVSGGTNNKADTTGATVCGGGDNYASGYFSIIGGGAQDTAYGNFGFVGGGFKNQAGLFAVVGGGSQNKATESVAAVCGGWHNTASDTMAYVGGGYSNLASGHASTVCGGSNNTADGWGSLASGGLANRVDAQFSGVVAGLNDTLTSGASISLVFGEGVHLDNAYRVVLFEGLNSGRVGINRDDSDGGINYPLHVGTNTSNGNAAYLSAGGTWTNGSSRSFKENFQPLDGDELLKKIDHLPVESWNYRDTEERHIGPVAEDFVAAFDVGTTLDNGSRDNKYLSTMDVAGVALAAVKELYLKSTQLEQKSERIEELEAQILELRALVNKLIDERKKEGRK